MAKLKSLPKLKKDVWYEFSRFIRLRDAIRTTGNCNSAVCITCGKLELITNMDCGHCFSRQYTNTLFHEKNNHAQCKGCNGFRSGEQYLYCIEIDKLYGDGTAEMLNSMRHETRRFSRQELIEMKEYYKTETDKLIYEYGKPWRK